MAKLCFGCLPPLLLLIYNIFLPISLENKTLNTPYSLVLISSELPEIKSYLITKNATKNIVTRPLKENCIKRTQPYVFSVPSIKLKISIPNINIAF